MKLPAFVLTACLVLMMQGRASAAPGDDIYAKPGQLVSVTADEIQAAIDLATAKRNELQHKEIRVR